MYICQYLCYNLLKSQFLQFFLLSTLKKCSVNTWFLTLKKLIKIISKVSLLIIFFSFLFVFMDVQSHTLSCQSPFPSTPTTRRALQRTLSDESIYSGQRDHFFTSRASLLDQAMPNDVLFTSTYPSLPKSLPLRRPSYTLGMKSLHGTWISHFLTFRGILCESSQGKMFVTAVGSSILILLT